MCGIAGIVELEGRSAEGLAGSLRRMARALVHRGPDDDGIWVQQDAGVGLCHRRLSIVDLSPLGHQPMTSASGRYVISFNGEVYNYRELREELLSRGHSFRGSSDTEVLLAAIEQWGVHAATTKCVGMFAFAVWDSADRVLHLVRDRFGEKPLYYGLFGKVLIFGSELRALRQHEAWAGEVDRDALALMLRHGYVPAPYSIFRGVRKVRPGCCLSLRLGGDVPRFDERPYWDPKEAVTGSLAKPMGGTPAEMVAELEQALRLAIRRQMVADVPVGAFLSGGIDSSLVVALMQALGTQPVRTFSIGFSEPKFNEAPFAQRIAAHLGTRHTELILQPKDALAVIPSLPGIYDEPFGDASQIPTYLVSKLARQHVTVSLSGDAGDELFGGYPRYQDALAYWSRLRNVPTAVRRCGCAALQAFSVESLGRGLSPLRALGKWRGRSDGPDRLLDKLALWRAATLPEFYKSKISIWPRPGDVVLGSAEPSTIADRAADWPAGIDDFQHMMFVDMCLYLPDDILVKVDRAAMAVSLETRVPFLDPGVAEAAWRIPTSVHRSDGRGKWVLRKLLESFVPRELFDRPKMGFGIPIAAWLRAELRPWADQLLDGSGLRRDGYLDASTIERRWHQHRSGSTDWSFHLWAVLMFQAWLKEWQRGPAVTR